jgi:hypothetical protein
VSHSITLFPNWVLSTQTPGKRYGFLSEPVSDWFIGGSVAQSIDGFHDIKTTTTTLHAGIDAYYKLGASINFSSHTLSDGIHGSAGPLMVELAVIRAAERCSHH